MGDVKIPNWLKGLPLAPEFHPTHTEFADPIAYISKIEKEASEFGICKIIPPLSKPSKKYVFSNLNKSLAKRPELGCDVNSGNDDGPAKMGLRDGGNDGEVRAVFTTRQQELGQTVKRAKGAAAVQNPSSGVDKQVWQSGEVYTLEQFESKARAFSKNILGTIRDVSPLVTEAMFWKAASEKPIYVEYANDVPGSAFEEPEGQLFYSHRQRRKRNCYQRTGGSSDSKKSEMNNSYDRNSQNDKVKDAFLRKGSNIDAEVSKSFASPGTESTDETPQSANKKNQSSSCDTEGTAGWKLSNSPWNLQVIARSPGSLTRFMPDDIPGVTSPMVYIGMLFSWFAWHIEDHELHSMNYLHNGSSKTWYSVPGADAFAFEELIRTEAYGGTADHLAALSLLGNKTTLMSPEVLITSGIPCCRLVQNPGEFVVTFPRAYHVGFSHGFNCGEAANFGTPQWLKVAKEAAVRRAAMNYYPMLSHQQLLYLSTMSFISRVPRALLPGVRSSRIRDRQREDRELSVKKAFIEDILNENDVLSALLGKDSSYRAVLWNPDLLPFACKESPIPTANPPVDASLKENVMVTQHGNSTNAQNLLVDEMSLYMENLDDLYLGSDDLSSDFQVDSGTLACVACGILGFPFMSVVQPSEKASMELNPESFSAVESAGVSGLKNSHLSPEHHKSVEGCATDDLLPISNVFPPVKDPLKPCTSKFNEHWNTVNKFLRPRSFCLEHAVETLELLQCKGGANMLVICHSDYQKIKAPAAAIAEEIDCRFNYKEVPLDSASMEDLNLIDLAVDDGRDECGEDWTSKLGINLRYCVKVRKSSSSKRVQHALALGGIFSKQSPNSEFPTVKWKARRSRSKKVYLDPPYKQCDRMQKKKEEATEGSSADVTPFKSERKVIQYSRRNKQKSSTPTEHPHPATSKKLDKHNRRALGGGIYNNEKPPSVCARLDSVASKSMSEGHSVAPMIEATRMDSTLSQVADTVALTVGSADVQIQNHSPEERNISSGSCSLEAKESFMHDEIKQEDDIKISKGRNEEPRSSHTEQINRPYPVSTDVSSVVPGEISAAADVQPGPISHSEEVQAADRSSEGGYISSSVIPMEETHHSVSLKGTPDVRTGSSLEESMSNGVTSAGVVKQHAPTMEALTHNIVESGENQPIPLLVEVEVSRVTCATNATLDDKEQVTKSYRNKELDTSPDTSKCEASHVRIKTYFRVKKRNHAAWDGSEVCISKCDKELERINANILDPRSSPDIRSKRKKGLEQKMDENFNFNGFIRGPCEGLRPRAVKDATIGGTDILDQIEEEPVARKVKRPSNVYVTPKDKKKEQAMKSHICNLGSCRMSFHTLEELRVHKHNRCPHEGCGKKFSCHKYAMVHTRVHESNRPFKCPWQGCSMSFKWVWAQTEHIRVHTGEKPYKCKVDGCGLSFRYVSDFSRHRRKTGHYAS